MAINEWQARYGKKRRAIDRALLAECERRLASEEQAANTTRHNPNTGRLLPLDHDALAAIALAFGGR
jgi:hypothetical protein